MDASILARTTGPAATIKELASKEAFALEPVLRFHTRTMEELIADDQLIAVARVAAGLAAALGGLALLLAAIGIYGVMAFSVAERTREIGIRMALGAQARNTQALIVKQGMTLILTRVSIGATFSVAVAQVLRSILFGLSANDPATYGGVALLLAAVALLACGRRRVGR